jgi:uncharacterized membrane protein YfcA
MFELATETALLLALAAFVAGFIDSIAGGGGLISMPALLLAGLSPVEALGTTKWQSLWGSGSATLAYASKGHIELRAYLPFAIVSALGAALGAYFATRVPGEWMEAFLPLLLIAIALYFAFKPNMSDIDRHHRISPRLFGTTVVPAIGFYDGVFGPGTGSFFMLCLVSLMGFGVLKATAHTKLLNLASNIGSFAVFVFAGAIVWKIGLLMGAAQFLGARLGATVAMRNGSRLIKPMLVTACVVLAVRLLVDPANPLRLLLDI